MPDTAPDDDETDSHGEILRKVGEGKVFHSGIISIYFSSESIGSGRVATTSGDGSS